MRAISTSGAPAALGPYSQAIEVEGTLYSAGQVGLDPETGELVSGIEEQTHRVMRNLAAVLDAAGAGFSDVVKTTIYLADMDDFAAVNRIYETYLAQPYPARSTVQAARLPKDALVEIDVIARRP